MRSTLDATRWLLPFGLSCSLAACAEDASSPRSTNATGADSFTRDAQSPTSPETTSPETTGADAVVPSPPWTSAVPAVSSTLAAGAPTLFWLDVSGKVLSSAADPFRARTLVRSAGRGSDGIAIDLEHGHIYWTNMGVPAEDDGTLMRAELDGTNVTTLIAAGHTFTPKQLKLEPATGKLYWSDREGMRVMRADLDGEQIETLYSAGQGATARRDASNWCVGIAVDVAGGYFYWTQKGDDDQRTGSLRRAPLLMASNETAENRSDVEILFSGLAAPVDLDLDRDTGFLYWTSRGDDTVNRGPIVMPAAETAATRSDREILVQKVNQAIGIALDRASGLLYFTTAVGDLGRANLDGSEAEYLQSGNGALTGIAVVAMP